jgi:8-oxo-dGTP diphosphatase
MLRYTICFIKQGNKILLLNREKPDWMGMWNGVGGKIEAGETPIENIKREIYEETGIEIEKVEDKGIVTWTVDGVKTGGMHLYLAELPMTVLYETPRKTDEGILDWKEIDWILHPDNIGVAHNIPYFLPIMLREDSCYEYHCVFENGRLVEVSSNPLVLKP